MSARALAACNMHDFTIDAMLICSMLLCLRADSNDSDTRHNSLQSRQTVLNCFAGINEANRSSIPTNMSKKLFAWIPGLSAMRYVISSMCWGNLDVFTKTEKRLWSAKCTKSVETVLGLLSAICPNARSASWWKTFEVAKFMSLRRLPANVK